MKSNLVLVFQDVDRPVLRSPLAEVKLGAELRQKQLHMNHLTKMEKEVMEPKRKRSFSANDTPLDRLSISSVETRQARKKQRWDSPVAGEPHTAAPTVLQPNFFFFTVKLWSCHDDGTTCLPSTESEGAVSQTAVDRPRPLWTGEELLILQFYKPKFILTPSNVSLSFSRQ